MFKKVSTILRSAAFCALKLLWHNTCEIQSIPQTRTHKTLVRSKASRWLVINKLAACSTSNDNLVKCLTFFSILFLLFAIASARAEDNPTLTINRVEGNSGVLKIYYSVIDPKGESFITANWSYSTDDGKTWVSISASAIGNNNPKLPEESFITWDTTKTAMRAAYYPRVLLRMNVYNPNDKGSWRKVAPMPTARGAFAAVALNGKIYAIGGGENPLRAVVEEYTPETNSWRAVAPMSTVRYELAAVALNSKIYAIGGWNGKNVLSTVEEYTPETNNWRAVAPMPTARSGLTTTAFNGKIYAIGGALGIYGRNPLSTVEEYTPETNSWRTVAPMPTARGVFAAAALNGKIYAIGGEDQGQGLRAVEEYTPETNSWRIVTPMPTARSGLSATALNGKIYAIGGGWGNSQITVEEYTPETNSWRIVTPMPTARRGLAAVALNDKIYAIGGWNNLNLSTVEEYTPPRASEAVISPSFVVDNQLIADMPPPEAVGDNTNTHYVNANSPNPQVPFATPETAALQIMDAVNVAENGYTVQVAAGIYRENVKIQKDVSLIGAGADKTTIDGGGNGSVVTAEYIESPTKIAGFTITNGKALYGGGVLIRWCSSLTIENNVITGNTATDGSGGGIYCYDSSDITFSGNIVQNNSASIYGGGLSISAKSATIHNNQIVSNISKYGGGGIDFNGSGIIYGNTIKSNGNGGIKLGCGIGCKYSITVSNNLIIKNNKAGGAGGGIYIITYGGFFTVINNTIVGNEAREGGGIGCYVSSGEAKIRNNIVVGNSSTEGAGGIHNKLTAPKVIDYNDVWNNTAPKGDYYGCTPGAHDIHADPLFVDAANGDYHLQSAKYGHWTPTGWSPPDPKTSPCIDAGDPNDDYSLEPEPNGKRINIGCYGNTPEATRSGVPPPKPRYVSPSGKNILPYDTPEKAANKIQDAINEATPGDTVKVAEGTYDQGSWNGVQMKKGVNLEGGYNSSFTSRKPGVYKSYIIAGGIFGRGQGHGSDTVIGANDAILDGFVLHNRLWNSVIKCNGVTSMKISHNIITGGDNAAIELHASSPTIVNNVIGYGMLAFGLIWCVDSSSPIIENNIFCKNFTGIRHDETSAPIVKYNDFYESKGDVYVGKDGNISKDPLFVNPPLIVSSQEGEFNLTGDVHLKPGSPCIDAGNPDSDFSNEPQPNGGRINMGAYGNTIEAESSVVPDVVPPVITGVVVDKVRVNNGDTFKLRVTTETGAKVTADVSEVDTTQKEVTLQESATEKGVFTASVTVSKDNKAVEGMKTIKIIVSDAAGNFTHGTASIELKRISEFTLALNKGINMVAVPLKDEMVTKVSELAKLLSPEVSLIISYNAEQGKFQSFIPGMPEAAPANVEIKGDTGLIVQMKATKSITFKGVAWSGDVQLTSGINLIGIPLKDPGLAKVSNLAKHLEGKVSLIISYNVEQGKFQSFAPGMPDTAPVNVPIDGGIGLIVMAKEAISFTVTGEDWENEAPAAPPIAQFMTTPTSSPVLELDGVIKSEDIGATLNGISVTVQHLNSGISLTDTTGGIAGDGRFSVTFVDFSGSHPVQVGDVLEISARDITLTHPLPSRERGIYGTASYRIEPVRYTVTESDIQAGRVALGELVARLIPSRSELMSNFPNPFNPETWIPFKLAEGGKATITIYDVHGRLVRMLSLGYVPAGIYQTKAKAAYWDGSNESGERVASGVYFYTLQSGKFSAMRKMVILK